MPNSSTSKVGQMIQEPKIDADVEPKTEIEEMDVFERLKKYVD